MALVYSSRVVRVFRAGSVQFVVILKLFLFVQVTNRERGERVGGCSRVVGCLTSVLAACEAAVVCWSGESSGRLSFVHLID